MFIDEGDFLQRFGQNSRHLMWFLGAGTSRSAGLPTATDIIWDLKRRYYCREENQDIQHHDIGKRAVREKIQAFCDSRGFPKAWDASEYSFYFDVTFGNDDGAQQQYIREQLASEKVSLNIGHRALAALMHMQQARAIFTTNFDDVIEKAYAEVNKTSLSAFHIEGAYAALDALTNEEFPIYAKLHGDFRYRGIKNLSQDLLHNDEQLQKCFLTAASRFGLIVSGYSGRDQNVMSMLGKALSETNAFPKGIFWTVPQPSDLTPQVSTFIEAARAQGVNAYVLATGTFDTLLSRIWRQIPNKTSALDTSVRTTLARRVAIQIPKAGNRYPFLRANALPILKAPTSCGAIKLATISNFEQLREAEAKRQPNAITTYTNRVLFWGDASDIRQTLGQAPDERHDFHDPYEEIRTSTVLQSFFEEALMRSLCVNKSFSLRERRNKYYLVVESDEKADTSLDPLRRAIGASGAPGKLLGKVPSASGATWSEALSVRLDIRLGSLWLLLTPIIWISPPSKRELEVDFVRARVLRRYNRQANEILDAWIFAIFGKPGGVNEAKVECLQTTSHPVAFTVGTRTAFGAGTHG